MRRCSGVLEDTQGAAVEQRAPSHFSLVWSGAYPVWEQQSLFPEAAHRAGGRTGVTESVEEGVHCALYLLVGVEDDAPGGIVHQPRRKLHLELAAAGLGQLATEQASA
jgi:hypothetical protein